MVTAWDAVTSKANFTPRARFILKGGWHAVVDIELSNEGSWRWTQPCHSRRHAIRVARRQWRKLEKAYERGELVL